MALVCHASQDSNSSLPGACTASDTWVDADEDAAFIQVRTSSFAAPHMFSQVWHDRFLSAFICAGG